MSTGSPRQLWLLPVLLITVIATALGALVARTLYTDQPPPTPTAISPAPSSSVPPSEQPGSPEVRGTQDATSHPLYRTLQPLLQRYFDAINAKDYDAWTETVTSVRVEEQDAESWHKEFRSTTDGSIVMYRIEAAGDSTARVLLQFTSTQAVEDAPRVLPVDCIHWNLVWPFEKEKGEWRLAGGSTSASPIHEPCATP